MLRSMSPIPTRPPSTEKGVWGVGLSGTAALGLRADLQVMYIEDTYGNRGIILIGGGGAGTPSLGAGVTYFHNPHADTIFSMEGSTVSSGGSVLLVGGDANFDSDGNAYASGSVIRGLIPAEIHATLTFGKIVYIYK